MSVSGTNPIPLIGYADRLSAQPGERIRFMVSSDFKSYRASIVRMIHADSNNIGPGYKEERIETPFSSLHKGKKERYPQGSYVVIPDMGRVSLADGFTLQSWIFPTTPGK